MSQTFPFSTLLVERPVYPGVSIDESNVLRDWLRAHGSTFHRFEFGARVGLRDVEAETAGAVIDRMWALITRPRPDLIALRPSLALVVEVKVHARMRAVTQVRRYVRLLQRDRPELERVEPVLVCRSHDPGVDVALRAAGGRTFRFPAFGQGGPSIS